ncbi:MAG: AMP-binding protein, partial [Oligoflexia bacterium]|nr:AMP-binding protein [Oligoflexia bacterium]
MTSSSDRPWLKSYPSWVPATIDADHYRNIMEVFDEACGKFAKRPAFTNMGHSLSYDELGKLSRRFAAFLTQECKLKPGDRIALQLPNLLQYPVALFGAIRAGLIVVNTNPLYTEREMQHQFKDSGAKAIVILANFADKLEHILPQTQIETVIITELGDLFPAPKRWVINAALKYIKKMVPTYNLKHYTLRVALGAGGRDKFHDHQIQSSDFTSQERRVGK